VFVVCGLQCAEFYGREFSLFDGIGAKGSSLTSLAQLLEGSDNTKRRAVLLHMTKALMPIVEKGILHPPMVHRCVCVCVKLHVCAYRCLCALIRVMGQRYRVVPGVMCVLDVQSCVLKIPRRLLKGFLDCAILTAEGLDSYCATQAAEGLF